jgi:hypothetical protein
MIAVQTTEEFNYDNRNPSLIGKIRIEVVSVRRDPSSKMYFMHIKDWAIYKYIKEVPVFEEQQIEVPVYDEEGNDTGKTTTEIQTVQIGTDPQEFEGIRLYKENKNYPVSYEEALGLEQAVYHFFPPDENIQGAELRDYITKYGLYLLTTMIDPVPTYNMPPDKWIIL